MKIAPLHLLLGLLATNFSLPQSASAEDPRPAADDKAARTECIAKAKQIAAAAFQYTQENEGYLPKTIEELEPFLHARVETFSCPFDPKKDGVGFEVLFLGKKYNHIVRPEVTPLVRAKFPLPDGFRVVAFADGHAELVKDAGEKK